jgi:pimeloyl-ACP methyl ester carboxylesterase
METIDVEGLRIAYERAGTGPAVVLLHGYVADGSTTWRRQIDALSDEFTVVAWDAPGSGGSSDPPESFGMAGYSDCLAGFVAGLGLRKPFIVGLSFGGALAIEFSRRHPAVPNALVLASAYAGWGGSLPADVAAQRLRQALTLAGTTPDEFRAALLPTMFTEGTAQHVVDEFGASMLAFRSAGFRAMARASAEDLRDALPQLEAPTLLVYGDRDVRAPLDVAQRLHSAITNSRLVVLPGVGHVCNAEAPHEFNTVVRNFLREHCNRPESSQPTMPGQVT